MSTSRLSSLLPTGDPQAVVARGADGVVTRGQLLARAHLVMDLLPEAHPGSRIALVFGHDRFAFAAALLGTWLKGHGAAVAENSSRERIQPVLEHPQTVALLHDTESGRAHHVPTLPVELPAEPTPAGNHAPDPALACVTTDPDGQQRWQTWTMAELLQSLEALAVALPLRGDQRLVHTFSPGFQPALFAGCLLPLALHTPIDLDRPVDANALAARSQEVSTRALLLDHGWLQQLVALPPGRVRAGCAVFTANQPSPSLRERLPFDVQTWPGICDLGAGDPVTGDPPIDHLKAIDDLRRQDGIDDLTAISVPLTDTVLVAVAGPAADAVADAPPPAAAGYDDVRVQAFEQLPRDANGKLLFAELFLAFGFGRVGQEVTRHLSWTAQPGDGTDDALLLRTEVPRNYRYYEGHFATYPVMAGAVQLHELVLPCLRTLCGELPALQKLNGIKFLSRISPGETIDVVLKRHDDPSKIDFEVRRDTTRCTAGRLSFAAPVPDFDPQGVPA